jgi:hypothetical protein
MHWTITPDTKATDQFAFQSSVHNRIVLRIPRFVLVTVIIPNNFAINHHERSNYTLKINS